MVLLLQFYGFEANAVLLASFFPALMFSGKQTLTPTCFWQFLNGNWCHNRFGMFIDSKLDFLLATEKNSGFVIHCAD